jgi:hypothetical protein
MGFKDWLDLQEARFKGFQRLYRQQNPDMPRYVQNDLYNSRAAHALGKVVHAKNSSSPTTPLSQTPISGSNSHIAPDQQKAMQQKWASTAPSDILSRMKDDQWLSHPEVLVVTPANFTQRTQWYFLDRRFGYREEKQIRNDAERTNFQRKSLSSIDLGQNEPVIVRHTPQGYELLEGWHRTMTLLLKGAPADQVHLLQSQESFQNDVDFSQWQPVKIKAYIALSKEMQAANAGTGEYIPADLEGTGSFKSSNT